MRTRRPAVAVLLIAACLVVLTACASGEDDTGDAEAPETTVAGDGSDDQGGPGPVVAAAGVTCARLDRDATGLFTGDVTTVPCDEEHDQETFELRGTDDLDDCYRAVEASSDIEVGPSTFDEGELSFVDERVSGHAFSGGMGTISCSVQFDEPVAGPLIGS